MPNHSDDEPDEDFLEVDQNIPGQNFACISFVSPEKVLNQKEKYIFYHYQLFRLNRYNKMFTESFSTMVSENEDGMVEVSRLMDMRKSMDSLFKEDEMSFDQFKEKFDDFLFRDEENVGKKFDELNEFKTSVRGLKVRGVYDTRREADIRAKVLQRKDQTFDVFVGQVGYWLPWDPDGNKLEDQEYLNNDLNSLVKGYKNNEVKKDMFYEEQKAERKKDAMNTSDRLRRKLDAKKKIDAELEEKNNTSSQTLTTESNITNLSNDLHQEEPTIMEVSDVGGCSGDGGVGGDNTTNTENKVKESQQVRFEVGGDNSKEVDVDETIDILQETDPWLKRKMEEKDN